jgi:23S rRNA (guanosine2251-2'-O)-methyltransferase
MSSSDLVVKNPHSILAALKNRPKDVLEINLPRDKKDDVWEQIEALAERNRIRLGNSAPSNLSNARPSNARPDSRRNPAPRPDSKTGAGGGGRESGHGACIKAKMPDALEQVFSGVSNDDHGVWIALDSLQDPQNIGAIFRSAAFFGIRGIILTTERSAPITSTVYDIASGGVETVPHVQVINLQRAFEKAKAAGLWILGTSEHAKQSVKTLKHDRSWLLVMGNEEKGIRRLTEESCDMMCTIPNVDRGVTSLNVAVATGILLSHLT